jgi:N-acetylmuramoyl-L-alanine amidase CwlA
MDIKTKLIPKNTAARSGYSMTPKYITIHNTANTRKGANAASHANYLQNDGKNQTVSYHYVVDDKEIYKLLPDNEVAWHAGDGGSGTGNRKSLAIEICENPDGNLLQATNNAVELTAYLMKTHNIPLSNVVQHNNWSGKDCPRRIRNGEPYNWQTFLNKVQAAFVGSTTTKPAIPTTTKPTASTSSITFKVGEEVTLTADATYSNGKSIPNWVKKRKLYVRKVGNDGNITVSILKIGAVTGVVNEKYLKKKNTFTAYKVRVVADVLNIRAGAGTNYKVVGTIADKGIYTIVAQTGNWGLLKSGAGWISLSYTKKV